MQYTDTLTKGFLTGNGLFINNGTVKNLPLRYDVEDPTYLGFYWHIVPNTVKDPLNYDLDYLPQGLFLPEDHPDSAIDYLKRTGEYYRANMMREFAEGFKTLLHNQPWAFDKVTGLGEISKIDPKQNFRGKEKKLVFEGNETLSMRLTYLLDLYRKAAFDPVYMRWKLPETQRFFEMRLVVAEIRTMGNGYGGVAEPGTFLDFIFEECEFTAVEDGFEHIEDLANYPGDAARVKVGIKVGRIRESNAYGLMGALLADTFQPWMTGKEFASKAFADITRAVDATGEFIEDAFPTLSAIKSPNGINDFTYPETKKTENTSFLRTQNKIQQQTGTAVGQWSSVGQDLNPNNLVAPGTSGIGNAELKSAQTPENALGKLEQPTAGRTLNQGTLTSGEKTRQMGFIERAVRNFVEREINAAKLGNVYGLSLANLSQQLALAAQDPLYAIKQLMEKLAGPSVPGALGNIGISQTQTNLLQVFASQLKSANAEYSASIIASKPSQVLEGAPGIETLAKAIDPSGNPGIELLANAIDPSAGSNPGSAFTAPKPSSSLINPLDKLLLGGNSNLVGNPGKEIISGSPSSLQGALGQVPIFVLPQGSGDDAVELKGPKSDLVGSLSSEDLSGAVPSLTAEASLKLEGADIKLEGSIGIENLEGAQFTPKALGQEKLEGPEIPKIALGKENLNGNNPPSQNPGKEDLEGPETPKANLGNIGLE